MNNIHDNTCHRRTTCSAAESAPSGARCMTTFLFLFRDLKIRDAGRRPSSGAAAAGAENAIKSWCQVCEESEWERCTNCVREIDWFMFMLLHGYD